MAIHGYRQRTLNQLDLRVGDVLDVLDPEGFGFIQAWNEKGELGYVPSNHIKKIGGEGETLHHDAVNAVVRENKKHLLIPKAHVEE